MIKTQGQVEKFAGSMPSVSPVALAPGVFSSIAGGVPSRGGFARIPGKTIKNSGVDSGGTLTIYQLGELVVVQKFTGLQIFNLRELAPNQVDFVYDNLGNLVYDNEGIPVTT